MSSAQKLEGFTLIELLIVVSIITILSGVMLPGFSNYISGQSRRQAIEQVEDDLRTLENKALAGDSVLDVLPNGLQPLYWGVRFEQNQDRYQYFVSSTNTNCYPSPVNSYTLKTTSTKLPGDNVLKTGTRCVFFSFANSDVTMRNSSGNNVSPMIITIGLLTGNVCNRVQLNAYGLIEVFLSTACT